VNPRALVRLERLRHALLNHRLRNSRLLYCVVGNNITNISKETPDSIFISTPLSHMEQTGVSYALNVYLGGAMFESRTGYRLS
jgi:hypothetical protein